MIRTTLLLLLLARHAAADEATMIKYAATLSKDMRALGKDVLGVDTLQSNYAASTFSKESLVGGTLVAGVAASLKKKVASRLAALEAIRARATTELNGMSTSAKYSTGDECCKQRATDAGMGYDSRFRGTVNPQKTCYRLGYGVGLSDDTVQSVLAATTDITGTMKSSMQADSSLKWQYVGGEGNDGDERDEGNATLGREVGAL